MKLTLAVGASLRSELTAKLTATTVGRWPRHVTFIELGTNRNVNEDAIRNLAAAEDSDIYASADITTARLEDDYRAVKRFSRRNLEAEVCKWLDERRLSWQGNVNVIRQRGAFRWSEASQWRSQFAEVNPQIGIKVADGLLAQLEVQTAKGLQNSLLAGPACGPYNAFFLGSDPHSGDHGLLPVLSQAIDGPQLFNAFKLPALPTGAELHLFSDGGWSGGEAVRRLKCMATPCDKKNGHVGPTNTIAMRFAYLTDVAALAIQEELTDLTRSGHIAGGRVLCPADNKIKVRSMGEKTGMAFRDKDILYYVDPVNPAAMFDLCETIGLQLSPKRPMGTHGIASTIAFEHSLPKALLPLFIYGGKVKTHMGKNLTWRPLLDSAHVSSPAMNADDYHCEPCALQSQKKRPAYL